MIFFQNIVQDVFWSFGGRILMQGTVYVHHHQVSNAKCYAKWFFYSILLVLKCLYWKIYIAFVWMSWKLLVFKLSLQHFGAASAEAEQTNSHATSVAFLQRVHYKKKKECFLKQLLSLFVIWSLKPFWSTGLNLCIAPSSGSFYNFCSLILAVCGVKEVGLQLWLSKSLVYRLRVLSL